jgi:hypothetical protein
MSGLLKNYDEVVTPPLGLTTSEGRTSNSSSLQCGMGAYIPLT